MRSSAEGERQPLLRRRGGWSAFTSLIGIGVSDEGRDFGRWTGTRGDSRIVFLREKVKA